MGTGTRIKRGLCPGWIGAGLGLLLLLAGLGWLLEGIQIPSVSFSAPSGFYKEAFSLELRTEPGAVIYYTLDASDPDENALLYTGPIPIIDATTRENIYSMISEVSLDFREELLREAGTTWSFGFSLPLENIDKATVVRAMAVDAHGNRSAAATAVYWVGFDQKDAYDGLYILSVTTDPANLFDYDRGIYVTGRVFDESLVDGKVVTPITPNFGWWPGNYTQKGIEWEREAQVSLWDPERKLLFSDTLGLRIQGGSSRGFANKSLNLFVRDYSRARFIDGQALFSQGYPMESLNVYSGGHSSTTKLPDYLAGSLGRDLRIAVREFRPCALFLEGEFWGIYYLAPRYKEEYFFAAYGVPEENLVMIKDGYVEIGRDSDLPLYRDTVDWIAQNDMSLPENYEEAARLIDMESCLDYYALEIYIANNDWPSHNFALWRAWQEAPGEYSDGKWRWILFDVNFSMASGHACMDMVSWTAERDELFASLLHNDGFHSALEARLVELAQGAFHPDRADAFIDDYEARMEEPMALEFRRFFGDRRSTKDFTAGCEDIRYFFRQRYDYVMSTYGGGRE